MIDREQWMRENRFKNMARLLANEIMQLPNMPQEQRPALEKLLAYRLYASIMQHALDSIQASFSNVIQQQIAESGTLYVDIPDLTQWPDS